MMIIVKSLIIGIIGLVFLGTSYLSLDYLPPFIVNKIQQEIILKPGSKAYDMWVEPPLPLYNRIYFFNITNGKDVEENGAKPILTEIGPFTYIVLSTKESMNSSYTGNETHDDGTISYFERRKYIFQRHLSVADDTTLITTINTPLALALIVLRSQIPNPILRRLVIAAIESPIISPGFFIPRRIKDLLFDGYPDRLTRIGELVNPKLPRHQGRFGYLVGRNDTADGPYKVYAGTKTHKYLNHILTYKNSPYLRWWTSEQCNSLIDSTNGQIGPPMYHKDEVKKTIRFFMPELCRTVDMFNDGVESLLDDVHGYRFRIDRNAFRNADDYPPNACYAPHDPISSDSSDSQFPDPLPSGVFDLSACSTGVPIMVSLPHFLFADQYYLNSVVGMKPNVDKHDFWMNVEPLTGSTVNMAIRIQLNVPMKRAPGMTRFRNIPEMVFPAFWQEITMYMDENLAKELKFANNLPSLASNVTFYFMIASGIVMVLTGLVIYVLSFYRNRQLNRLPVLDDPNFSKDDEDVAIVDPRERFNSQDSLIPTDEDKTIINQE